MSHALVVNVHCAKRWDVYVGRVSQYGPGTWGNPFVIGRDGNRAEVIAQFRAWLPQQRDLMRRLPELRGKVLGCFCAPAPCHADVLAEMANRSAEGNLNLFGGKE